MSVFKDKAITVYPTYGYRKGGGWRSRCASGFTSRAR